MELRLDGNDWQLIYLMPSEWVWRQVWHEEWEPLKQPAAGQWINSSVPGDVISDALDAHLIPDPCRDMQSRACEWLSERDWVYRKSFDIPAEWQDKVIRLRFDGIDHTCHIYMNGESLGSHDGMFTPFEYNVSKIIRFGARNQLLVVVEHMPPIDAVQGQIGWTNRARIWKARFVYSWDWCTRLVPLGIWQSVRLSATSQAWLDDVWVHTQLEADLSHVSVQVTTRLRFANLPISPVNTLVRLHIYNPQEQPVMKPLVAEIDSASEKNAYTFSVDISDPQLWYPNGMGEQPLYRVLVEILDTNGGSADMREVTFGLRKIRAIPNEGASTDALPYTLEVNGQKLFVMGWNWTPIDNLYGRPQLERYERLLILARHAHCNLLRVWGGGLFEREAFYDLCDRMGILVWQEFAQSSSGIQNAPPDDDEYLAYVEEQVRQLIPLRRNHPSLAIWCGGNELMDSNNVPLDDTHPALARIRSTVHALDPDRIWLPTSSSGPVEGADSHLTNTGRLHDVHGPWNYLGLVEQYSFYNTLDALYHSEFGSEGATNLYTLKRFISTKFRFPPDATNPAWVHHGSWWLHRQKLESMFGPLLDIETFVKASQWMHAEGLRYAIEANRRRQWRCSGVSPWQLSEAFPNTACTSAVDYLGLPKPAFWWIRRAYEPVHISLKYERITWQPGASWRSEVWISCTQTVHRAVKWSATLLNLHGDITMLSHGMLDLPDNASIRAGFLYHQLPVEPGVWILLLTLLDAEESLLSRNEYVFSTADPPLLPVLAAPLVVLGVSRVNDILTVTNESDVPALFVHLEPLTGQWLLPDDDYTTLAPREARSVRVAGRGNVSVRAWNSPEYRLRLVKDG